MKSSRYGPSLIVNLFNLDFQFAKLKDSKLISIVKKTKSSSKRKEEFHELCKKHGVKPLEMIQDVVTRWSFAHDMFERAIYLRKPIDAFVKDLRYSSLKLSENEWAQIEFVYNILLPLKACCMRLQQTTRPGIEKVFWTYESLFNELDRLAIIAEDRWNLFHYLSLF